jgi:hypothetical protein
LISARRSTFMGISMSTSRWHRRGVRWWVESERADAGRPFLNC